MTAFAYYRLPYLHHATYVAQHEGEPEVLPSVAELNGKEGFVIAPFSPSGDCPVLLIHPDETKLLAIEEEPTSPCEDKSFSKTSKDESFSEASDDFARSEKSEALVHPEASEKLVLPETSEKQAYSEDFALFHDQLTKGIFRKIVLARKHSMHAMSSLMPSKTCMATESETCMSTSLESLFALAKTLFMRACRLYPRLFVALVYTPQSGMWLMATPEVLLKGDGNDFSTMSLAGTQRAEPSRTIADYPVEGVTWSEKNQEEQQYVTDYIEQCVKGFSDDYSLKGPYTTMAANLYHLRTDISFRVADTPCLGDVLERLYPTPAVCGIPKAETRDFILRYEHQSRKYYSGFVGPLQMKNKTHLFVSLRCMNILEDGTCELYAGGGLLKESEMEKEWKETEAKMMTIKNVILH